MEPISPIVPGHDLPEGCYAKDQPQYRPLPYVMLALARMEFKPSDTVQECADKMQEAANDPTGTILTRWHLSDDDRRRVAAGQDLYLQVMTFGRPLQPLLPQICTPDEIVKGVEECNQDDWSETIEGAR